MTAIETFFWLHMLFVRHKEADRALHKGLWGSILQGAEIMTGPVTLTLLLLGQVLPAAIVFLGGAFANRFGWIEAGRVSALDPEAVFASQL